MNNPLNPPSLTFEEFSPGGKSFSIPSSPIIRVQEDRRRPITILAEDVGTMNKAAAFLIDLFTNAPEQRYEAVAHLKRALQVSSLSLVKNWASQSYTRKREDNLTTHLKRLNHQTQFLPEFVSLLGLTKAVAEETVQKLFDANENSYFLEILVKVDKHRWIVDLLIGPERPLTYIARVPYNLLRIWATNKDPYVLQDKINQLPDQDLYRFVIPSLERVTYYRFHGDTAEQALFAAYQFAAKIPAFYSYQVENELVRMVLRNDT